LQLSGTLTGGWLQTFFGLNAGLMPNKLFQQPVGLQCTLASTEAMATLMGRDGPPTVARLLLNDDKALELFVVLPAGVAASLLRLSRSGQDRFLGDMFRALYGDSAELWGRFAHTPMRWRLLAVRHIPSDAIDAVSRRLEGGGLVVRQVARMDEGQLEWMLAIPPHTWHWLMRLTAKGMAHPSEGLPNRQAIFRATGWGQNRIPWARMIGFLSDRDLSQLIRGLDQARLNEPVLAAVAAALDGPFRERWLEAMPVMLRERTNRYRLADGEASRRQLELTRALISLHRNRKLPEGPLSLWVALYTEFFWSYAQYLIDQLLPLRHLIYGMDRASLSRALFDSPGHQLPEMLSWAEFPVVDQVRRALTPGATVRLLEDIAVKRGNTSAFGAQAAQLGFYRLCYQGMIQGRYLVRSTPAQRLRELVRILDEGE
jgi:hypothetical protein